MVEKRAGLMRMVGKGLEEGSFQWVGVYEDGRWFSKGWGFKRMVGKGLGEGGLQKGGVYEDG